MGDRFIVEECSRAGDDRVFKNNKCIFNQNLGFAYSAEETVEVLNQLGRQGDFLFELIQVKIWYCQAKYKETGDERWLIEESCLKTLRKDRYDESSISKYSEYLKERCKFV